MAFITQSKSSIYLYACSRTWDFSVLKVLFGKKKNWWRILHVFLFCINETLHFSESYTYKKTSYQNPLSFYISANPSGKIEWDVNLFYKYLKLLSPHTWLSLSVKSLHGGASVVWFLGCFRGSISEEDVKWLSENVSEL